MFNAVRMDIYRLIHTKSAYVILGNSYGTRNSYERYDSSCQKHGGREHRGNN